MHSNSLKLNIWVNILIYKDNSLESMLCSLYEQENSILSSIYTTENKERNKHGR